MEVELIIGDDWIGLYFNEVLILEGHAISEQDIFEALIDSRRPVISFIQSEADTDWLESLGNFPTNVKDVRYR